MENHKSFFETRVFKVLLATVISVVVYVLAVLVIDYLFVTDRELLLWHKLVICVIVTVISVLSDKNISIKKVIFVSFGVSILYALANAFLF